MNHTPQIKKAIQFAARKHDTQYRKETEPLPYIVHPLSVALLLGEAGANDDVVIAGLLHDTLEDTDATIEEITSLFGEQVAALVAAVSEKKMEHGQKIPWKERKDAYLAALADADEDAVLVAIADKIDNIESKLDAFEKEGTTLFNRWSQPPEMYIWYHGAALKIAEDRLPNHPLTKRLAEVHARERSLLSGI